LIPNATLIGAAGFNKETVIEYETGGVLELTSVGPG